MDSSRWVDSAETAYKLLLLQTRPHRLVRARTPDFQSDNRGSNPRGVTFKKPSRVFGKAFFVRAFIRHDPEFEAGGPLQRLNENPRRIFIRRRPIRGAMHTTSTTQDPGRKQTRHARTLSTCNLQSSPGNPLCELKMTEIDFEGVAWVGAQRLPRWRQPQEVVGNASFPARSCVPAGNSSTWRIFCDCLQRANFLCLRHTGSRSASTGATRDSHLDMSLHGRFKSEHG